MDSKTPNRRISDLGLLARLRKMRKLADDARGNSHTAEIAMTKFEQLCARNNIDPKSLSLDGYRCNGKNVIEFFTDSRHLDANLSACCLLIGEFFHVHINASRVGGRIKLDFIATDPIHPDDAFDAFKLIWARADAEWTKILKDAERGRERYQISRGSVFEALFTGGKPSKRSFVSGFFNQMHAQLDGESKRRHRMRKLAAPHQKKKKPKMLAGNPAGSHSEPETPWILPPENPMALMCLPKRKPGAEISETVEGPKQAPPPISETDPEFHEEEPLDRNSWYQGVLAAKTVDLTLMKL